MRALMGMKVMKIIDDPKGYSQLKKMIKKNLAETTVTLSTGERFRIYTSESKTK